MAKTVLRLGTDDVLRTLETLDPVELLAEELIKRTIGHPDASRTSASKLVPWTDATTEIEYVRSEDLTAELGCAMPAATLRMIHAAALAALATRELLVPGGVTVAMLGTRFSAQAQLSVLARHVPDIVHVAVRITDKDGTEALEPRLVDQLDLAGIGVSVVTDLADSLFGANLVVASSEEALAEGVEHASVRDLVRGTLLVNSSGHDLPPNLLDHVDEIYVDDLALLPEYADRYAVARHLAHAAAGAMRNGNGVHPPRIAADLGLLLTGARPGRAQQDGIVVVDLLSAQTPDIHLANTIAETAMRGGLGERVTV